MAAGVFDLYSVGIGPSASHTVGPMRAARTFATDLDGLGLLDRVASVRVELFGSLGATGRGHGTDGAVVLGLEGEHPESVEVEAVPTRVAIWRDIGTVRLLGRHRARMGEEDVVLHAATSLPFHPNGMRFRALAFDGTVLLERTCYSVGGGFVVGEGEADEPVGRVGGDLPYPFTTAAELGRHCTVSGLPVSGVMLANEAVQRTEGEVVEGLLGIWAVMQACVAAGIVHEGTLPGGLGVPRRAPALHRRLEARADAPDPLDPMDWMDLFALAVNEENAAGGRVVTAPTNGAAGIVPAVLHYYRRFVPGASDDGVVRALLTAGAVGLLVKANASISGAEVGCQGEVGTACAMAAAALCEVLGGTPAQVENAAEIGMEHNLGLTCDPVGGLVQVPCIERNAMGAVKAVGTRPDWPWWATGPTS